MSRLLATLFILLGAALSSIAWARASTNLNYGLSESYSTALRFVRIDRGCAVTDKDPDAAFVTFECKDGETIQRGSLELYHAMYGGHDAVRVQVTLGDETHGAELRFLELFERKLRDERGSPVTPPTRPPPSPNKPADGGV